MSAELSSSSERDTCLLCFRPRALCYCHYLPRLESPVPICVVQHPREQFHSLGTARLAERAIAGCEVVRGSVTQLRGLVPRALEGALRPVVVYPGEGARDLEELRRDELDLLVFLDGTWPQAKALLREIPALASLPQVRFRPERPSEYQIRRPPGRDCLSTLESIAHVLTVLAPEVDSDALRNLFRRFIATNIEARPTNGAAPRRKLRAGRGASSARAVAGESFASKTALVLDCPRPTSRARSKELASNRDVGLGPVYLARVGSSGAVLTEVVSELGLVLEKLHPGERLVSWSAAPLTLLKRRGYTGPAVCLKELFCNRWRRAPQPSWKPPWGGLGRALRREELAVGGLVSTPSERASFRLGGAVALWRRWLELEEAEAAAGTASELGPWAGP